MGNLIFGDREIVSAILKFGKCARRGSPRFLKLWASPEPNELKSILKNAIRRYRNKYPLDEKFSLFWGDYTYNVEIFAGMITPNLTTRGFYYYYHYETIVITEEKK